MSGDSRGKALALAIVTALGCGCGGRDQDLTTWGDLCVEFSEAWCGAAEDCGYPAGDVCRRHTTSHCCEVWGACEKAADADQIDRLDICVGALSELDDTGCYWLGFWGRPPDECFDHLAEWPTEPVE